MEENNTPASELSEATETGEVVETTEQVETTGETEAPASETPESETVSIDESVFTDKDSNKPIQKDEARESTRNGIIESQLRAYHQKIKDGVDPSKAWDAITPWVQKFITPVDEEPKEVDTPVINEQSLVEKTKSELRFDNTISSLKQTSITPSQKQVLESEYQSLRGFGVPKDQAIEKAIALAQIKIIGQTDKIKEAQEKAYKMGKMAIPQSGSPVTPQEKLDPLEAWKKESDPVKAEKLWQSLKK